MTDWVFTAEKLPPIGMEVRTKAKRERSYPVVTNGSQYDVQSKTYIEGVGKIVRTHWVETAQGKAIQATDWEVTYKCGHKLLEKDVVAWLPKTKLTFDEDF